MISINLPSREAFDALPDVFFWPVPMVRTPCSPRADLCNHESCGERLHPEWLQAGEPCPTCDGNGWWWCDIDSDEHIRQRCGSCLGGKPLIAITVPCECASEKAYPWRKAVQHIIAGTGYELGCDGRVTGGQAVIEHGPGLVEHAWKDFDPSGAMALLFVNQARTGAFVVQTIDDPKSLVGTWGVICRKVQP